MKRNLPCQGQETDRRRCRRHREEAQEDKDYGFRLSKLDCDLSRLCRAHRLAIGKNRLSRASFGIGSNVAAGQALTRKTRSLPWHT